MEKKKIVKNVLKVMLIIIAILIVILIIHSIRNYIIITDLQKKISKYDDSSNHFIKSVSTESNGTIIKSEYYQKDDKQVLFLEKKANEEIVKISIYNNGKRIDIFTETKDVKEVTLNSGPLININIINYLETDNKWQTIICSVMSKIKSTKYNGKDCYIVKGFMSSSSLSYEEQETYIDKDTGLALKIKATDIINEIEYEYEFNNVDDEIFAEPDISQYTLIEKK